MNATVRVLLGDDHKIVREGLKMVLADDPLLQVVAEAGDGDAAWRAVQAQAPDARPGPHAALRHAPGDLLREDAPQARGLAQPVHLDERCHHHRMLRIQRICCKYCDGFPLLISQCDAG